MNRYKFLFVMTAVIFLVMALVAGSSLANALPVSSSLAAPQAQVILEPTAMAWVSSVEPSANFGGRGYIWVGYGQGTGEACCSTLRGLVKLDLSSIPANAHVTDAVLYATIWDAQGPPDHFVYYAGRSMDQATCWTEGGVTWNNKPNAS